MRGVPKSHIAARPGKHRETIHIWIKGIEKHGLLGFLDRYEQAKKGERKRRQVDPMVKRLVWKIREREFYCCGQKIQYFLNLEHGIHLSVPKIYETLAEKYIIRSKWKKNKERGSIPEASQPREVIQMDTIDFGDIFAFTAIDIFTKEADVLLAPNLTAKYGSKFLFQSRVWEEDLMVMYILFKLMADQNLRQTSLQMCIRSVIATGLLDLTEKTSNPTLKVSTGR